MAYEPRTFQSTTTNTPPTGTDPMVDNTASGDVQAIKLINPTAGSVAPWIAQAARTQSLPVALSNEDAALLADLLTITAFQARTPALGQALAAASSPVVLASDQTLPLPSGAATSAKQDTQITAEQAILAKLIAAPATEAKQDTEITALGTLLTTSNFDSKAGSLTETAPATDTASSGLNGRLQRIAQRLTSLITALGSPFQAGGSIGNTAFGATQSGTWNVTNVSGTVSLPTGAATAAKQPALGTAGSASADVITIQGIASGTVVPVSAASLPLPSGAATEATLANVATAANQSTNNTRLGDVTEAAPASDTASSGLNGRLQRIAQNISTLFGRFVAAATLANGTAIPSTTIVGGAKMSSNSVTLDLETNNIEGIALASALRTVTTATADILNVNNKGVMVFLNVTAASGTGGLQVRIQCKDPISGTYTGMNAAPAAVIATGHTVYLFGPLNTSGSNITVYNGILPRTWRISVTHGDSSNYTYSVGYCMVWP